MARWLVTGANGRIGQRVFEHLQQGGHEVVGLTRDDLDLTSAADTSSFLLGERPDIVVNAAGYSLVDSAEHDEGAALAANATAVAHLTAACSTLGGRLIHISTDLVFDGTSTRPYETDDATTPRTAYGRSKLAGERFALSGNAIVLRVGWVYGGHRANFVDTMIAIARAHETVDVVADQMGSPVNVDDLAGAIVALGRADLSPRVLHYANTGVASWFDLAQVVFAAAGADPQLVQPTTSDELDQPARRPDYSVLSTASWTQAGLPAPRSWRPAVDAYVHARIAQLG